MCTMYYMYQIFFHLQSLDYDDCENELYQEEEKDKSYRVSDSGHDYGNDMGAAGGASGGGSRI